MVILIEPPGSQLHARSCKHAQRKRSSSMHTVRKVYKQLPSFQSGTRAQPKEADGNDHPWFALWSLGRAIAMVLSFMFYVS